MNKLNFSWVIQRRLAGCAGPKSMGDLLFLKQQGITCLIRLAEDYMAQISKEQVEKSGLKDYHEPIDDFTAPPQELINKIVNYVKRSIEGGGSVAISCGAGIGRTGMILSCILISQCHTVEEALDIVRRTRNSAAWETDQQYQAILTYAKLKGTQCSH